MARTAARTMANTRRRTCAPHGWATSSDATAVAPARPIAARLPAATSVARASSPPMAAATRRPRRHAHA